MKFCLKYNGWLLWLLLNGALAGAAFAQKQPLPVKPQPVYEQCEALRAGKENDQLIASAPLTLKGKEAKTLLATAQQLSRTCDSRAVAPLIELLKHPDPLARIAALEALARLGDTESLDWLIDLNSDSDGRVRIALISALLSFKTFKARNTVLNVMANPSDLEVTDEDDMRVRCAAILSLNQLTDVRHSRKAILFLMGFLESQHEPIRKLAEQTMIELKSTRNFATEMFAIIKLDSFFKLRAWAARWLGQLDIESGREVLENAAANDKDSRVRQAATEALKQLNATKH